MSLASALEPPLLPGEATAQGHRLGALGWARCACSHCSRFSVSKSCLILESQEPAAGSKENTKGLQYEDYETVTTPFWTML